MFALVAARRRKKLKEESFPLFVLFVLFGQAKRTLKENFLLLLFFTEKYDKRKVSLSFFSEPPSPFSPKNTFFI